MEELTPVPKGGANPTKGVVEPLSKKPVKVDPISDLILSYEEKETKKPDPIEDLLSGFDISGESTKPIQTSQGTQGFKGIPASGSNPMEIFGREEPRENTSVVKPIGEVPKAIESVINSKPSKKPLPKEPQVEQLKNGAPVIHTDGELRLKKISEYPLDVNLNPDVLGSVAKFDYLSASSFLDSGRVPTLSSMTPEDKERFLSFINTDMMPSQKMVVPNIQISSVDLPTLGKNMYAGVKLDDLFRKVKSIDDSLIMSMNQSSQELSNISKKISETTDKDLQEEYKLKFEDLSSKDVYYNIWKSEMSKKNKTDIYPEEVSSRVQEIRNKKKYEVLQGSGFVGKIDESLPENIKNFLMSSEYINSSSSDKKAYAKMLWMTNMNSYKDANEFYSKISNTFTPSVSLLYLKQKAKDLEAKAARYRDISASGQNLDFMSGDPISGLAAYMEMDVASKPLKILQEIIETDFERQSSVGSKFVDAILNHGGDAVPYVAQALELANASELYRIVNKVKVNGEKSLTEKENLLYEVTSMFNTYNDLNKPDWLTTAFNAGPGLISFVLELETGGAAGKSFAQKMIKSVGSKTFKEMAERSPEIVKGAYDVIKGIDYVGGGQIKRLALNGARLGMYPFGVTAQMAAARGQTAVSNAIRMVTDAPMAYVDTEDMKIIDELTPSQINNFPEAIAKAAALEGVNIAALDVAKILGAGQNNLVGKLLDKFEKGSPAYNLIRLLKANEVVGQTELELQNQSGASAFLSRIKQLSPASAVPDLLAFGVAMPPAESIILGEWDKYKDRLWANPTKTLTEDIQNAAIGLFGPIVGGKIIGVRAIVDFKRIIFRNEAKFNDFAKSVFDASKEEFLSKEFQDKLSKDVNSFLNTGSLRKDKYGRMMESVVKERMKFERGEIDGAKGETYKEYIENSIRSQAQMTSLTDAIANGEETSKIIQDGIEGASDASMREQFEFHRDLINSYPTLGKSGESMKEYVDRNKKVYTDIKEEFRSLNTLSTAPNWSVYEKRIADAMLPNTYKQELRQTYDELKSYWEKRNEKLYGKKDIAPSELPDVFVINGEKSHTFIKSSDGSYRLVSSDPNSFNADFSFSLGDMSVSDLSRLGSIVRASELTQEQRKFAAESMRDRILEEFNEAEFFADFGGKDNMGELLNAVSRLSESAPLSSEQKSSLQNSIQNVLEIESMRSSSQKNVLDVRSAMQLMIQNAEVIDIAQVLDLAKRVNKNMLKSVLSDMTDEQLIAEAEDAARSGNEYAKEAISEEVSQRKSQSTTKEASERIASILDALNMSPVRTNVDFDKLRRNNKSVDKIVKAAYELLKQGALTEPEVSVIENILCSYNPNYLGVKRIVLKDSRAGGGSRYSDKSKTITITYEKGMSKGDLLAEIIEEINHSIQHNIYTAGANGGVIGETFLSDNTFRQIFGNERVWTVKEISDWYRSNDYSYERFLMLKEKSKSATSMTAEERAEYLAIKDMLVRFGDKYGQRWDNLDFVDKEPNSLGWRFTTESLVRNWNRYRQIRNTKRIDGRTYTAAEAFYYSAYEHEYFARTIADYQIADVSNRLTGANKVEGIMQKALNFVSRNVTLPSILRAFRSGELDGSKDRLRDMMSKLDEKNLEDYVNNVGEAINEDMKEDMDKILSSIPSEKSHVEIFRELASKPDGVGELNKYIFGIAEKAKELGYDESIANDVVAYLAKDANVKGVEVFAKTDERDEVLYVSNTLKALENLSLEKGSGAKFIDKILATGGKKVEMERYGLIDFLQNNRSITKQEVLDYLADKVMKVKDVVLGGDINQEYSLLNKQLEDSKNLLIRHGFEDLNNQGKSFIWGGLVIENDEDIFNYTLHEGATKEKNLDAIKNTLKKEQPNLSEIEIKNLSELLINAYEDYQNARYRIADGQYGEQPESTRWSEYTTFPLNNYRELLPVIDTEKKLFSHEHHFSGIQNQLYHNRLNDVTTVDGKKLLLSEEMQGDWTQKEKAIQVLHEDLREAEREFNDIKLNISHFEEQVRLNKESGNKEQEDFESKKLSENKLKLVEKEKNISEIKRKILQFDSPYQKTSDWVRAAIKRMIKMAVDEGKDGIAWTPAHLQVERWSNGMRSVANKISWAEEKSNPDENPNETSETTLRIKLNNGEENENEMIGRNFVFSKNDKGEWIDWYEGYTLEQFFGSEISKKILSEQEGVIEGENIIVGGQGYIDIYDKTAVDVANKLAKKYGVQVGSSEVKENEPRVVEPDGTEIVPKSIKVHSLLFNEQMRDDIAKQNEIEIFSKTDKQVDVGVPSALGGFKTIQQFLSRANDISKSNEVFSYGGIKALESLQKTNKEEYDRLVGLLNEFKASGAKMDEIEYYAGNYLKGGWYLDKMYGTPQYKFFIDDSKMKVNGELKNRNPSISNSYANVIRYLNGNMDSVSDSSVKWDINSLSREKIMLGEFISHKKLFDAYPDVENIEVKFYFENKQDAEDGYANITDNGGVIGVNVAKASHRGMDGVKKIVIHELQHKIQKIEGFADGINTEYMNRNSFLYNIYLAKKNRFPGVSEALALDGSQELNALVNKIENGETISPKEYEPINFWAKNKRNEGLDAVIQLLSKYPDYMEPYELYRSTLGEVEAFDAMESSSSKLPATLLLTIGKEITQKGYYKPIRPQDAIALSMDTGAFAGKETYAKTESPVDVSWFKELISSKDSSTDVSDIEKLLSSIDENIQGFKTEKESAKRGASQFAKNMVELWKASYIKSNIPSETDYKKKEILRLVKVPTRINVLDYVKDVKYIQKIVQDANLRNAVDIAERQKQVAFNKFMRHNKENIPFYVALNRLSQVDVRIFETKEDAESFTKLLKTDPNEVNTEEFKSKVDEYYDRYLSWKSENRRDTATEVEEVEESEQESIANEENFLFRKRLLRQAISTQFTNKGLTSFDKDVIDSFASVNIDSMSKEDFDRYETMFKYLMLNPTKPNRNIVKFTEKVRAQKFYEKASNELSRKYVELINRKSLPSSSVFGDYFKGLVPGIGSDKLGNLAAYNAKSLAEIAEGMSTYEPGVLRQEIIDPINENYNKFLKEKDRAMREISAKGKYSLSDMHRVGIKMLLSQRPQIQITSEMIDFLNSKGIDTDGIVSGEMLSPKSEGNALEAYNAIAGELKGYIKDSILVSFGIKPNENWSDSAIEEALADVSVKSRRTKKQIQQELKDLLESSGVDSLEELIDKIGDGTHELSESEKEYEAKISKAFADVKDGVYSDGLSMQAAAEQIDGIEFQEIENYFPIIRYKTYATVEKYIHDNESEDAMNSAKSFYGMYSDLHMSTRFLQKRKGGVMALQTNAFEAAAKRLDEQIFYLNNARHRSYLRTAFRTPLFYDKGGLFNVEATNQFAELINGYYNRGLNEERAKMQNDIQGKWAYSAIQRFKALYVGDWLKSPAQLSTIVFAASKMQGNPINKFGDVVEGSKDMVNSYIEDSPENLFLREYAPEVYFRGMSQYDFLGSDAASMTGSTSTEKGFSSEAKRNSGRVSGTVAGLERGMYKTNKSRARVIASESLSPTSQFGQDFNLAGLKFHDRVAARASLFSVYRNTCKAMGVEVSYTNPNMKALNYAMEAVRETQNTDNPLYKSGLSYNIAGGSRMTFPGDFTMINLLAFKSYAINERQTLMKSSERLKNAIVEKDGEAAINELGTLAYSFGSKLAFNYIKLYCQKYILATVAAQFMGEPGDKKNLIEESIGTSTEFSNVALHAFLDYFVLAEPVKWGATVAAKLAETKWKDGLSPEDREKYIGVDKLDGGIMSGFIDDVSMSMLDAGIETAESVYNEGISPESFRDAARFGLYLSQMKYGVPGASISNDFLRELNKQSRIMNTPRGNKDSNLPPFTIH